MRFLFSNHRQENVDQLESEGYNLELRKFKRCKLHIIEGYDSEIHHLVHVLNPKIIVKTVVSILNTKKSRLMDKFDSLPYCLIIFFYSSLTSNLFIYLVGKCAINIGAIAHLI
jgi:hypothetical protein